jgi:GT2 family glycosyltransferase
MNIKNLTIIITTIKSENKIHSCLDSIPKDIEVLVIENSENMSFKTDLESKYLNVKCFLTGDNIGYAAANNIGLSKVNSKYALVLNPDTKIGPDGITNFLVRANQNPEFWLIGPAQQTNTKNITKDKNLIEVNNIKGFAIFFNMEKFGNRFFDDNFFLYFEEIDLCNQIKLKKGNIYIDLDIKIHHEGAGSVDQSYKTELEKNRNWHWMWSSFYFHKKYKGFFLAFVIIFPKLISSFFKTFFYLLTFNKNSRDIYFCRLSGIFNSIIGKKSWYRPTLD